MVSKAQKPNSKMDKGLEEIFPKTDIHMKNEHV